MSMASRWLVVLGLLFALPAHAGEPSLADRARAILEQHCQRCHGGCHTAKHLPLVEQRLPARAPAPCAAPRPFLTTTALHRLMRDDLWTVPARHRRFIRYLSLANLHNAVRPASELKLAREALGQVVNS